MSGRPIALVGHHHICPTAQPGPKPHVGGPIAQPQQSFVRFNGVPVVVRADKWPFRHHHRGFRPCPHQRQAPVARIDDAIAHDGRIVHGVPSVA